MAIVCPLCGAENRDKARFCRGCAHALDQPAEALSVEAPDHRARDLRRTRRRQASQRKDPRPAWSRWALVLMVGALALGLGWWLGAHQKAPAPALAAHAPGTPAEPAPLPAAEPMNGPSAAPKPASPAPAEAAVDRLRESVQRLEQEDRLREAALAQQRQKLPDPKRLEETRRRTDALSVEAAQAAEQAFAPQNVPEAPPVVAAAPVGAAVASRTVGASVDQLCADSGNVFARDFCRIRECGKAVFASDPVCVRFRQMDEARGKELEYR
jgi:hypothetical protein